MAKAVLLLEDGSFFEGESFGADGEKVGEVVFNTSMTGYQEILTDPSYNGQIVCMTYPLIGNYGVNDEDVESRKIFLSGFIAKECCQYPSNFRATKRLDEYLKENGIQAIHQIDTRALTKRLRIKGSQQGIISTVDFNKESLMEKLKKSPGIVGQDLVKNVTCTEPYIWEEGDWELGKGYKRIDAKERTDFLKVAALDFGIKSNILRMMVSRGLSVKVFPAFAKSDEILREEPDGIFLSNGPGDPEGVPYAIKTVEQLLGKKPIFGICLGLQILTLALGGKTYKLKFGHHGANHPVKELATGKVEITSQNHGFAADINTLKNVTLTHLNLNDETVEGFKCTDMPAFAVQYHPEASPGPHDSRYLFDKFKELILESKKDK
ncbi:MAG: carbamoyl-phosphate synthase small subunit [Candidatus Schekmanbacteria bacterium]|nr:MAG: carbamoyl-phosphate synthase small subunit [Candidatus Schekmanbacteria bacterium]